MSDIAAVETLTREQYLRRQYHATAGPSTDIEDTTVLERWRTQRPDWRGKYWTLTPRRPGSAAAAAPDQRRRTTHLDASGLTPARA